MAKVFVGNFSFSVDDEALKGYFSKVGTVLSAKVMTEGHGGRSRGFGFVEFPAPEDAEKAISELDGSSWDGRVIKVSEDRGARRREDYAQNNEEGGDSGYQQDGSQGPMGYFRAQPFDLGIKRRKKADPFVEDPTLKVDYKDPKTLVRFMSERGRILPRRMTGLTSAHQRMVSKAIKRAQQVALLPYSKS